MTRRVAPGSARRFEPLRKEMELPATTAGFPRRKILSRRATRMRSARFASELLFCAVFALSPESPAHGFLPYHEAGPRLQFHRDTDPPDKRNHNWRLVRATPTAPTRARAGPVPEAAG